MSIGPPAGNGTTILISRSGYVSDAARSAMPDMTPSATAHAAARRAMRRAIMDDLPGACSVSRHHCRNPVAWLGVAWLVAWLAGQRRRGCYNGQSFGPINAGH